MMRRLGSATGTSQRHTRWSPGVICRAFDGSATIQQPLIAPLYGGKSAIEVLALLLGEPGRTGLEIVRDYWRRQNLPGDFETVWRQVARRGLIADTARTPKTVTPRVKDVPAETTASQRTRPGAGLPARPGGLGRPIRQ